MEPRDLLGPLEGEVIEVMWEREQATVREVLESLRLERTLAYTTVMTVMNNLVTKGLLERVLQRNAYMYRVALSRKAFLEEKSREAVSDVLARFGDLAIARFMEAMANLKPEDRERLRQLGKDRTEREEGA